MKTVTIIGAGIGGCAAAIAFAQQGWYVTVIERIETVFTEGAGILLYSNALKTLDSLSVLDTVLKSGYVMQGQTEFLDADSQSLGTVTYNSIDSRYPAYVGINRMTLLQILYHRACHLRVKFLFGTEYTNIQQNGRSVSVLVGNNIIHSDLLVAADGTNSEIRNNLWENSRSTYSGFGLWHSMHKLHPSVKEKITVVMPDRKFGIIPMNENQMYIWASLSMPEKIRITKDRQAKEMYHAFSNVSGFLKEIIEELDNGAYVHYTSVEEVAVDQEWHQGRIVLLGDAAHASLPFMAQGGAMALQDAAVLAKEIDLDNLDQSLKKYMNKRKPVVDTVQQMCRNIGKTYSQSTVDLEKVQLSLNKFYSNTEFFN